MTMSMKTRRFGMTASYALLPIIGNMPGGATRDPVSVLFDRQARILLARVYRLPRGVWAGVRVAPPTARHLAWAAGRGMDLLGPDNASTASGQHEDARTRWLRGMVRALYYQHKWYSDARGGGMRDEKRTTPASTGALQVEVGGWLGPRTERGVIVVPGGHAVRARLQYGGKTARRVVQAMPDSDRIWTDDGAPAARFSLVERRDW